ncbi:MAG: metallophosphoesterase [Planctomycetota bacterium]
MPTIAQISDLHLQSGVPERQAQVEPILQKINEIKPDLVVISGDVTDDGWDSIKELEWANEWLEERIDGDWFAVPGNHDVGNFVSQNAGRTNEDRIHDWAISVGSNSWSIQRFEIGRENSAWFIYGLNSMIHGSNSPYEKSQIRDMLDSKSLYEKKLDIKHSYCAVFVHSPFFCNTPNEPQNNEADYWLGPIESRIDCFEKIRKTGVTLIGSGHVHQTRLTEVDGIKIAWAPPASGTWVHAPGLPNPPMPDKTGFFLHTLHDDGRVESELIECAPMLKLYEHNP